MKLNDTLSSRSEEPDRVPAIAVGFLLLVLALVYVHEVWLVDRFDPSALWTATVQRGSFVHTVRAAGVLALAEETSEEVAMARGPEGLKAVLEVHACQAADVRKGQPVTIDTRQGLWSGRVSAIGPSVQGIARIDVRLDPAERPPTARLGLAIDGTIELERIEDALFVDRPVQTRPFSTIQLVQIAEDGMKVPRDVRIGRLSVRYAEILEGLEIGDEVVISDLSQRQEICVFPLP